MTASRPQRLPVPFDGPDPRTERHELVGASHGGVPLSTVHVHSARSAPR